MVVGSQWICAEQCRGAAAKRALNRTGMRCEVLDLENPSARMDARERRRTINRDGPGDLGPSTKDRNH